MSLGSNTVPACCDFRKRNCFEKKRFAFLCDREGCLKAFGLYQDHTKPPFLRSFSSCPENQKTTTLRSLLDSKRQCPKSQRTRQWKTTKSTTTTPTTKTTPPRTTRRPSDSLMPLPTLKNFPPKINSTHQQLPTPPRQQQKQQPKTSSSSTADALARPRRNC